MRSQSAGHLRLFLFGVAAIFSRRRFSSHRLGPQPPERNIIAQIRSIQRISYFIPYSGPICHHGCRALHHKSSKPLPASVRRDSKEEEPIESTAVLVIGGVIRFHCVRLSLPRIMRGAQCVCLVFFCRSCVKLPRRQRSSRTGSCCVPE